MLRSYLALAGFAPASIDSLAEGFATRVLAKGECFAEAGRTSRHLGFVERGVLQYYVLVDGEERTTHTVMAGQFVASLVSFFREVPARENIRAVTDSVVLTIDRQALSTMLDEVPGFKDFYIGLLEWEIGCIDTSRLDGLTLSPTERYRKLVDADPGILGRIPLQYVASMLGVTPRHLSRIRGALR